MRQRVISSGAVMVVGLVPLVLGGPVFALLMILLGLAGYHEFLRLTNQGRPDMMAITLGTSVISGMGVAALAGWSPIASFGFVTVAVFIPLLMALARARAAGTIDRAARTTAGSLYLALPVFAAISLRGSPGAIDQAWLSGLSRFAALDWPSTPRGLAWTGLAVLCIWVGDSVAFLAGRALGRHPLAPMISPKKTVEGSIAGLLASSVTGLLCAIAFGLELSVVVALAVGAALGGVGQFGDLAESLIKRQAGVKDSGTLIPGHGGVLDRIDALLPTFPIAWLVVALIDGTIS